MAKREKKTPDRRSSSQSDAWIKDAGVVVEQPIIDTLQVNDMPYAMSVIISRALPEIDGFKPSHRKLLYTMYKMGLLSGGRTKSANVVGQTMRLNPHGDAAIYETMVRLTRGNEALLQDLIKDENAWLNMLKEGATTTFEAFSKDGKVNASLFHTMFAFPALFMIKSDLFDREEDER